MLFGFENETAPLSEYELDVLVPLLTRYFRSRYGEAKAVKNHNLCKKLVAKGYVATEARIRKVISHIRITGAVPCLVASSKGYYRVRPDSQIMKDYIESLKGRELAIRAVREAMEEQML